MLTDRFGPGLRGRVAGPGRLWGIFGLGLDALHVFVRETEMMPDFMHQNMTNDIGQILARLAPVVEYWPTVEEYAVDIGCRRRRCRLPERDSGVETEYVERTFQLHLGADLLVGKILDNEGHTSGPLLQDIGKSCHGVTCQGCKDVERRGD